jgi:AraC-like DNA-binding protein
MYIARILWFFLFRSNVHLGHIVYIIRMKKAHHNPDLQIHGFSYDHLSSWQFANMSAPYWRFYWNRLPGATLTLNGVEYPLTPDHFFLLTPNTAFSSRLDAPVDHLYLHFTASEPYWSVQPEIFQFKLTDDIHDLTAQVSEALVGDPRNDQRLCVQAYALAYLALSKVPADRLKLHKTDPRIDHVLEMMDVKLERRLTNDELAEVAVMHPNAFTRLFKSVTGMSPQKYMNVKRVERACIMLHNTSVSIEEVAEALGFCDRFHFSRVFKQVRGVGPAAFIKTLILAPTD